MYYETNNNYLAHHGILGQRWGVRRYQNSDGSLTTEGRNRRRLSRQSNNVESKKSVRNVSSAVKDYASKKRNESQKAKAKRAKDLEKAKENERKRIAELKAKKAVENEENLKQRLRAHPRDIYKYRNQLSKEDVDEIMAQVQWDRKCKDISREEYLRGLRTVEDVQKTVRVGASLLNDGLSIYNSTALIYNGMLDHQVKAGNMSAEKAADKKWQQMKWKDEKKDKKNKQNEEEE